MRKQIMYVTLPVCLAIAVVGSYTANAGDIDPPIGPVAPTMKTLTEVEPRTPIWSLPFTISSSGSYYLASSLTGIAGADGITIVADNVTLDLNGFALIGVPGSSSGILFGPGVKNPAVRNGTIRDWGSYGVGPEDNLNRPTGGLYEDLRISGNAAAHGIAVGPDSRVLDCNSSNNAGDGFNVVGIGSVVKNCTARGNGGNGFIDQGSSVFVNCAAVDNGPSSSFADGFDVGSGGVVIGCAARGNGGDGFLAANTSVILTSCIAISNVGFGINAPDSLIRGCLVANNGEGGCNAPDSTLVENHGSASCSNE